MFNLSIAVRRRGTIDVLSGTFKRGDAVGIITTMTDLPASQAVQIVLEGARLGKHKVMNGRFEVRLSVVPELWEHTKEEPDGRSLWGSEAVSNQF